MTTFQQPEFAAFGALFLLLQAPLLCLALLLGAKLQPVPVRHKAEGLGHCPRAGVR